MNCLFRLTGRNGGSIIHSVILLLLLPCKRRMLHLQFECLTDIRSVTKPERKLITRLDTLRLLTVLVIEHCKLICPFLRVLRFLELLEKGDLFLERHVLCVIYLVQEYISVCIVGF